MVRLTSVFSCLVYPGVSSCEYLGVYRPRLTRCLRGHLYHGVYQSSLPLSLCVTQSSLSRPVYLGFYQSHLPVVFTPVFTCHVPSVFINRVYFGVYQSYLPRCILVMFPRYLPIAFTSVFTSRDYLYFHQSFWSRPVVHLSVYLSCLLYLGVYRSWTE